MVAGEISTETYVDVPRLVRDKIADIGYTHHELGLDAETCGVITSIQEQSPDIARGVDKTDSNDDLENVGAGDQGMMFGYACRETPQLMPLPITLAHAICRRLAEVRKAGTLEYLRPDGKSMVTVRYEEDEHGRSRPIEIDRLLVVSQHADGVDVNGRMKADIIEHVLHPILPREFCDEARLGEDGFVLVNPTGKFVVGGPKADTGLTGRKIIVDSYGGAARQGGGCFSGKDPTKVDRSGAYATRHVAKNIVAAGLADRCELEVAYAIGVAQPVSVTVECFGTEAIEVQRIEALVAEHFDLRPAAIIRDLDLLRPDLHENGCVRPLRPRRRRLHVGAHGPRRRAARGCRPRGRCRDRLGLTNEEAVGGRLADRSLRAVDGHREMPRSAVHIPHFDC